MKKTTKKLSKRAVKQRITQVLSDMDRAEAEKAALKRRLLDMACGADCGDVTQLLTAGEMLVGEWLSRWLCAIRDVLLGGEQSQFSYLVGVVCVGDFENIQKAVDHLHRAGVRADGSHLKQGDESAPKAGIQR